MNLAWTLPSANMDSTAGIKSDGFLYADSISVLMDVHLYQPVQAIYSAPQMKTVLVDLDQSKL